MMLWSAFARLCCKQIQNFNHLLQQTLISHSHYTLVTALLPACSIWKQSLKKKSPSGTHQSQGSEKKKEVAKPMIALRASAQNVTCHFHSHAIGQNKSQSQVTCQWSRSYNPSTETNLVEMRFYLPTEI